MTRLNVNRTCMWSAWTLATSLALFASDAANAAQTPGPGGTYNCWDRCVDGVSCQTSCYDDGALVTCAEYSSTCGPGGGTVGQRCGDGLCYYDANLGFETACNCPSDCAAPSDLDNDGIPDSLEHDLALRFFPNLWLRWVTSDLNQSYGRVAQIPYVVSPLPGSYGFCGEAFECLEIRYGLAYNWDCGDNPGDACSGTGSHRGDSEFYALYVSRRDQGPMVWGAAWNVAKTSASYWRLMADFASAHFNTGTDSSSYLVYKGTNAGGNGFNGPAGGDGSSTLYGIFASEGKHANYHSIEDCNRGGFLGADFCVANYNLRPYAVAGRLKNVGSLTCNKAFNTKIYSPASSGYALPTPTPGYNVWSGSGFADSSPYAGVLSMNMLWLRVQSCVYSTPCWELVPYSATEEGLRTTWTLMALCAC